MHTTFINEIIILVIAAFLGGFLARSIKLPPVVGYLVSGIIFGTVGKAFIPSFENLFQLSQIGISLLLFTLGFEVSLETFRKINKTIIFVSILQVIITSVALFPILLLFQFSLQISILFALLFSFSSTAVVLKILEEKGMVNYFPGNNVFVVLLIQDLFLVPIIFLMPLIFASQFVFPDTLINFLFTIVKPLVVFILMFVISRLFLSKILKLLFRYPQQELTILATIFVAVLSMGLLIAAGLPESIAAFFAGVLISEEGKNLSPLASIKPLRDILLVLFFVLIGMLIDGRTLFFALPFILALTSALLVVKFFVIFGILRFFRYIPSANFFITSYLTNIGEMAVVVAQIAFVSHFISEREYESLLEIFIVSLILIPVITIATRKTFEKYKNSKFLKRIMGESHFYMRNEFDKFSDHVIILGHGRVGREVRSLLEMGGIEYVVVDFDRKAIEELVKGSKSALYGDPTDVDVLIMAGIKQARILVVALPDTMSQKIIIKNALHLNPKLLVLCRSHVDHDKYELVNLGVNTIVIPEFEAGLRIGKKIMELLGFEEKVSIEFLRRLRKFHYIH